MQIFPATNTFRFAALITQLYKQFLYLHSNATSLFFELLLYSLGGITTAYSALACAVFLFTDKERVHFFYFQPCVLTEFMYCKHTSWLLKVMPGDLISISTRAWYKDNSTATVPTNLSSLQPQLLDLLMAGIVANAGTHGGAVLEPEIRSASDAVLTDFLTNKRPTEYNTGRPKAFLNWV